MAEAILQKPKVTLYWLEVSRAQRIVWILEECREIDWELQIYKRQNMLAPKELKEIHPLGKSPIISVASAARPEGLVIAESALITEYLCDNFASHLIPRKYQEGREGQVGGETEQWMRYRYYMHYAEGTLFPLLLIQMFMDMMKDGTPFLLKPLARAITGRVESMYLNQNLKSNFSMLEVQLASSPDNGEYLCGKDLTGADILMSFPLFMAKSRISESLYPKLWAYIKRLEENPTYQRSIKKVEEQTGEPLKSRL